MGYTVEHVKHRLSYDQSWIERALIVIYQLQTEEEKEAQFTTEANGVGFNAHDSKILSSFAEQLIRNWDYHLSYKQLSVAKSRMPKYAKQLISIIEPKKPNQDDGESNTGQDHGLYGLGEIF